MIQGIEIPMSNAVTNKKATFIRGIPSIFQCDEKLLFLKRKIRKSDLCVKDVGSLPALKHESNKEGSTIGHGTNFSF